MGMTKELDHFYGYFNTLYDAYKRHHEQYVESKHLQTLVESATGIITENARYIPPAIKDKINIKQFSQKVLEDRFQNVHITLEVYEPTKSKSTTTYNKLIKYIVRVVYIIIFLASSVHPLHELRKLHIKVVCSPMKKRLPTNHLHVCDKRFETNNVNSGVTTTFLHTGVANIIVFRREEVIKVLIHELLHAFGVDSKFMTKETEAPLNAFFGFNGLETVTSNESFTETYACLLNVFLASKFLCCDKMPPNVERSVFHDLVVTERTYIINQANKVVPLMGLEVDGKSGKLVNKCIDRHEDTHVISYYILKGLNFTYLTSFLTYLRKQQFKANNDDVEYVQHLTKLLNLKWVDKKKNSCCQPTTMFKKLNNYKKRLLKIEHDVQSLRMSCIDVSAI